MRRLAAPLVHVLQIAPPLAERWQHLAFRIDIAVERQGHHVVGALHRRDQGSDGLVGLAPTEPHLPHLLRASGLDGVVAQSGDDGRRDLRGEVARARHGVRIGER